MSTGQRLLVLSRGAAARARPDRYRDNASDRTYVLAYEDSDIGQFPPATPHFNPRVFVFDSSTRQTTQTELPSLGYFGIDDFPTCRESGSGCDYRATAAISPDGQTLFFAGDEGFLVVPVPPEGTFTPLSVSGGGAPIRSAGEGIRTQAWRLDLSKH